MERKTLEISNVRVILNLLRIQKKQISRYILNTAADKVTPGSDIMGVSNW